MSRSARPDLANALSACSAEIATAVREASAHLRARGVRHALASSLEAPAESDGVPVVSPEAFFAMKLVAHRLQDKADIAAVIESGAVDPATCRAWLAERGFDVALFDDIAASVTRGAR